jgi:hypothetical protein
MKISKGKKRTTFRLDDGSVIVVVAPKWPGWQVSIKIPPLPLRTFMSRAAAEQHAAYFASRACAQGAGYTVHPTADGRFTFKRPDGTRAGQPHNSESDAWSAACADSATRT